MKNDSLIADRYPIGPAIVRARVFNWFVARMSCFNKKFRVAFCTTLTLRPRSDENLLSIICRRFFRPRFGSLSALLRWH